MKGNEQSGGALLYGLNRGRLGCGWKMGLKGLWMVVEVGSSKDGMG